MGGKLRKWVNFTQRVLYRDRIHYRDFLIGKIQAAYRQITLISQRVDVRIVSEEQAVVVFSYSTDCIRRDSGEPFGIAGLETQVYCKEKGRWKLTHVHYSVQKE